MKTIIFTVVFMVAFITFAYAAPLQQREYNVWYNKDGMLYGMTQNSENEPVLVSIGSAGFESANMVISYTRSGNCTEASHSEKLEIDGKNVPAAYRCFCVEGKSFEHFLISDPVQVNYVVERLTSDFTVLIKKDIKLWAANVNSPKFGVGPRL
ncbi:hypothetical protein RI049_09140 [Cedecea neteri]|uniref:hypothetical protein n=1 Tax=Cedecea neteri TaxID=158822 RepID=UPI002AA7F3EC|nr:hypothetical protein [Cedecea neteri]WPU24881.1 hypothetical protein RI049_09140 [Cedecea neteri]